MPIEVKNYCERGDMPFLIIFVVIPLVELGIFAAVSEHIGLWSALFFALFTAVLGGFIVRLQGMQTIVSMRSGMGQGRMPTREIFDGFCLVAAGALLITPGFLTDAIGFSLLVPPFRDVLRKNLKKNTKFAMGGTVSGSGFERRRPNDPNIIEGEFENLDPEQNNEPPNKKRLS